MEGVEGGRKGIGKGVREKERKGEGRKIGGEKGGRKEESEGRGRRE